MMRCAIAALTCLTVVLAAAPGRAAAQPSAWVVASIQGNLVQFAVDGSASRTLTTTGRDIAPVVSPGGGAAAFLRLPHPDTPKHALANYHHTVMLITLEPIHGDIFSTVTRVATTTSAGPRRTIAFGRCRCAPELYFWNGSTLERRRLTGNTTPVLKGNGPAVPGFDVPIAVGPNDRIVAAPMPIKQGIPTKLRIQIAGRGTVAVTFAPGALGPPTELPPGSYVPGAGLAVAPDGKHLVFATIFRGEGYGISGIWQVPLTGGRATRILGTASEARGRRPFAAGLTNATQFQYSPNGKFLATDPNSNLWVRGSNGRTHTVHVPMPAKSCALAQWTWLSDSSGFAYVAACSTYPGGRMILGTVTLSGTSHILRVVHTYRTGNEIDLAQTTRCVACGG